MADFDLDRASPCLRPNAAVAGTQRWTDLLFVHWWFPVEAVRPLGPPAFELDTWDGRALVGLVPFRMDEIRSSWMPKRFGEGAASDARTKKKEQRITRIWNEPL